MPQFPSLRKWKELYSPKVLQNLWWTNMVTEVIIITTQGYNTKSQILRKSNTQFFLFLSSHLSGFYNGIQYNFICSTDRKTEALTLGRSHVKPLIVLEIDPSLRRPSPAFYPSILEMQNYWFIEISLFQKKS